MSAVTLRNVKKLPTGYSRLSRVLDHLNQEPKLHLPKVTHLKVRWNAKKLERGSKRFVRDALPRIRYANPALDIEVDKQWTGDVEPQIQFRFTNGEVKTISMKEHEDKPSALLTQVMDFAGGDPWAQYKKRTEGKETFVFPFRGPNPMVTPPSKTPKYKKSTKSTKQADPDTLVDPYLPITPTTAEATTPATSS
ncbi:hypothetical protein NP233_g1394 [Leucocoprinus birnbaumii]|uniref:Ribosomal protein/NADH dehydrogenase domain-containing protein n=1 Tax=Leucocoprinus birnbaumii TaxID=56174 RepID=A0AAD5YUW3_9AGAR|nr:hypothetical protein NP233_g1394 [Leucocoprinus birnbaumii]